MNTNNTSNIVPPTQGDGTNNPPAQGANSPSQGDQSSSVEALLAKIAKLEEEAFKTREKERQRKEAEQAALAQQQEQLQRNGEFQKLAEQQTATIEELKVQLAQQQTELARKEQEALRARIAAEYALPAELASRLVGATEEELKQDAATLKKLVPVASPGNGPNPKPAGQQTPEQQQTNMLTKLRASGMYPKI